MPRTIIIGAGVIGLTTALELRLRGQDVVVLDRRQPGAGSSSGNAGWIVPSMSAPIPAPGLIPTALRWMFRNDSPLHIKPRLDPAFWRWLLMFARHCRSGPSLSGLAAMLDLNAGTSEGFARLHDLGVQFEHHRSGMLFLGLSSAVLDQLHEELEPVTRIGYKSPRRLSRAETLDLEPQSGIRVAGGILVTEEQHLRPESFIRSLVQKLAEIDVDIRTGTEVMQANTRHRRIIGLETSTGAVSADNVLLAAGAWSGQLASRFGTCLPIEAGKGYSITVDAPAFMPRYPLDLIEARIAITPFEDALRLGGTMELSGLNMRHDIQRVNAIWHNAAAYLKSPIRGARKRAWAGMRPLTPDGLPVIGQLPGFDNLFVASGHGMLGVTLAPVTARAISQLIVEGRSGIDLSAFDPARFRQSFF